MIEGFDGRVDRVPGWYDRSMGGLTGCQERVGREERGFDRRVDRRVDRVVGDWLRLDKIHL